MTNNVIRRVIVLGALSMLSLLAVQTYWVLRTWDLQEQEFNRKVYQALLDASNNLAQATPFELPSQNLIDQLYSNYYVVNVDNDFDPNTLEFYLQKSFENQGLHEDFQYGVFDCSSKQMVTGKTIKYNKTTPFASIALQQDEALPPHNKTEFNYYFGVRFPEKNANILSNMWIVVVFTALMLITLSFFIYSMFVILRQKQLSELQRDFINNMTHEFKTPIATINVSTDVFLQSEQVKSDPRLYRYSGIIKEQVLRLNTQVEKVLQLAGVERDKIELNLEELNLAELIRGVSPSIEMKVREKEGGQLHLDLVAGNALIVADRMHLTNILHNLVDNGVKYSKDAPDITISLKSEEDGLLLSVQDKGIGISKEHLKRVFDKFYRIPTGNVHNVKGFGLGLFYVKTMCKEHKWKLGVESEPGKGTTMEIRIPVAKG
ncbi:MAG: HAMP domain-containing histidine kinase [Saprospiraceae bacterium]|nr:HAMP domain-containing histidine kinase [Saprospiraceae bacterium]